MSTAKSDRTPQLVLGIETSCDETGVALYETGTGLLAHEVFTQIDMHRVYGGVVPELASRDHIRRVVPLAREVLATVAEYLTHRSNGDDDAARHDLKYVTMVVGFL